MAPRSRENKSCGDLHRKQPLSLLDLVLLQFSSAKSAFFFFSIIISQHRHEVQYGVGFIETRNGPISCLPGNLLKRRRK